MLITTLTSYISTNVLKNILAGLAHLKPAIYGMKNPHHNNLHGEISNIYYTQKETNTHTEAVNQGRHKPDAEEERGTLGGLGLTGSQL